MDWIYPVGGLFVLLGLASVFIAAISGALSIKEAREERESNSPLS